MSGHSHWAGIKHKKGVVDQKRGQVFSKLLAAITVAARTEPNPEFNPRLRAAVLKAREQKVPQENIERAIKRAGTAEGSLEEILIEAHGPGGAAILAAAATNNRNRTISEIKKILSDAGGKWGETGSARWAFEADLGGWSPKFSHGLSPEDKAKLTSLISALEAHDDIQAVLSNAD
ncbi:hypothetical protein C4571_00765 [Candidatus Parcubacteria bacterium]|nr:MAG: hypothetical protein C4571_00765 [Candidatus Parcubacteria bacterium]